MGKVSRAPRREPAFSPATKHPGGDLIEWTAEFCAVLLSGGSSADAIERSIQSGASSQAANALAMRVNARVPTDLARRMHVQLKCSNWLRAAHASLAQIRQDPRSIDELASINQDEFLVDYYSSNRALLLKGIARDWPAVTTWGKDYLAAACGSELVDVTIGRAEAPAPQQTDGESLRRQMRFDAYLELIYSGAQSNDYYLVARNRFFASPETAKLLDDLGQLPFVNTRCAAKDVKMWLGPGGTYTPLHYDARNNLLVQVIGSKRFRLYAPYYSDFMRQTAPWYTDCDPGLARSTPNSSPDVPEISVRLEPGDALFIPVGWWHAVTAESVSLSLNFHDFGVPNEYPFP